MGNLLDFGVYAWLIIFALWGGVHGFVATLLGLSSWLGAGFAAERSVHWLGERAATEFSAPLAAPIIVGVIGFVVAFIALRMLTSMISGVVKNSPFSALNRGLGILGGIFAGAVLLSLAYFTASSFIPRQSWPRDFSEARTRPLLEVGAAWVAATAPKEWGDFDALPLTPPLKMPNSPDKEEKQGYDPGQRKQLERLLNQTQ